MIFTDRTITVRKGESRIDEPIVVYRGDYELEVRFTILNSRFKFMSGTNMIESEKASYGQLAILTPYGGNIFSDIVRCNDGSVTFVLTAEMLNQIEEVGLYSFQIRLMDYNKESRVSIPPIEFGIEVREPIASEDHDNSVNNAIVGYSIAKVVDPKEENVGDTFDGYGNYNKTKWETGDRISEGKLNKIEDAIDKINKNEKINSASLSKRIDNNFSVLDSVKADKSDVVLKGYATLNDFDEEARRVIQGIDAGEVNAVLGEQNVKKGNIDEHSVSVEKTTFATPISKNVLSGMFKTGFMNNSTNIWSSNRTDIYSTEELQSLDGATALYTNAYSVYLYDENKAFIEQINTSSAAIPSNAYYFRPNFKYDTVQPERAYVRLNNPTEDFYCDNLTIISKNVKYLDDYCIPIRGLAAVEPNNSIYNAVSDSTIREGGYYAADGGLNTWTDDVKYYTIYEIIEVNPDTLLSCNCYSLVGYSNGVAVGNIYDISSSKSGLDKVTFSGWYPDISKYTHIRPVWKYTDVGVDQAFFNVGNQTYNLSKDIKITESNISNNSVIISPNNVSFLKDVSTITNILQNSTIREGGYYAADGDLKTWTPDERYYTIYEIIEVNPDTLLSCNCYSLVGYSNGVAVGNIYDISSSKSGLDKVTFSGWYPDISKYTHIRPVWKYTDVGVDQAFFNNTIARYTFTNDIIMPSNNTSEIINNVIVNHNPKFMHISADDVLGLFKDLTNSSYNSIFEHSTFRFLKNMHDVYGMVFSGYCFYQDSSFDLSMVTDKFADEFRENARWLKFGVHWLNGSSGNFASTTASKGLTIYENIVTQLYRICGGFESIDTVPRFHNYAGGLEFIKEARAINMGLTGLLTADDTRVSYYLNSDQNNYILSHSNFTDYSVGLKFFSTDIRLESHDDPAGVLKSRLTDINYASRMQELVIFTHEPYLNQASMQVKIENCCKFAKEYGYCFDFPMYRI